MIVRYMSSSHERATQKPKVQNCAKYGPWLRNQSSQAAFFIQRNVFHRNTFTTNDLLFMSGL
jgi:hypothetical protein